MCVDELTFTEDICKELFDVYCSSVELTHRAMLSPNVCPDVARTFADAIFESTASPLYASVQVFLRLLMERDKDRATSLQTVFNKKMEQLKHEALRATLQRNVGGSLN